MANTTLTFTGDSADACAAIAKLERQYAALETKMKGMKGGGSQKDEADALGRSLDSVASKYFGIGAAMQVASTAAGRLFAETQKLQDLIDKAGEKPSELETKLAIQTGMSKQQVKLFMPKVESALRETPVMDLNAGLKTQTQLASSGIDKQDIDSGAALKEQLKLHAAVNEFGETAGDPKESAKTTVTLLKGLGRPTDAKNMGEVNAMIASLYKESTVEGQDFRQVAPKLLGLKRFGLKDEESLGTFSAGAEVLGGNKADSGLAQFVDRTSTAGAHKERVDALAEAGIKPEEVAMSPGGKSLFQTVDFMRDKFKGMDPVKRNNVISKLYGEEAGPMASLLFSDEGNARAKQLTKVATDHTAYDQGVKTFQESRPARQARTQLTTDAAAWKMDQQGGEYTWAEHKKDMDQSYNKQYTKADSLEKIELMGQKVLQESMEQVPYWLGMSPKSVGLNPKAFDRFRSQNVLNGDDARVPGEAPLKGNGPNGPATESEAEFIRRKGGDPDNQSHVDEVRRKIKTPVGEGTASIGGESSSAMKELTEALKENTRATAEAAKQKPEMPQIATNEPSSRRPINRNGNREQV